MALRRLCLAGQAVRAWPPRGGLRRADVRPDPPLAYAARAILPDITDPAYLDRTVGRHLSLPPAPARVARPVVAPLARADGEEVRVESPVPPRSDSPFRLP